MIVILLVVLTFIIGMTIDYYIKHPKKVPVSAPGRANNFSQTKIMNMLPDGVFLQPSFTWSKIQETGNLELGIHPILMGLVGDPEKVETLEQGKKVKKGDTIIKLYKDSKQLNVKAPVSGSILSTNPNFHKTSWENLAQTVIYGIKPDNMSAEISNWFIAEKSRDWLNEKFEEMKNFFIRSLPQQQVGLTMADGGELPFGILTKFDKKVWQDFEKKFFN